MPRVFSEDFYDLPTVEVCDWELWARLEELVGPHMPAVYMSPLFFATDSRGQYDAGNLAALRAEVEQQEEPPNTIRMTMSSGHEAGLFFNVYTSTTVGTGGRVQSGDEAIVNHVAARVRDLYGLAAQRLSEDPAPAAQDAPTVNVVTDVLPAKGRWERRREALRPFLYDQWVITVGGTLVAAGIIALIVTLTR